MGRSRPREGVSVLQQAIAGSVCLDDFSIHTQVKVRIIWRTLTPEQQAAAPHIVEWFRENDERLKAHLRDKHKRPKPQPQMVDYSFLYVNLTS